jgi:branched-chain amino acid aminotransferase
MKMPFVYFEGQIVPESMARISIASNSLQYGTTCFAGMRGYFREGEVRIMRMREHHERLMNASKILGMDLFIPFEAFKEIIAGLVKANAPDSDFYIRPFLYSSDEQLSPKKKGLTFQMAIYFVPMGHYFDPSKGMRLMVSSWRKFSDAALPTKAKAGGCYVNSYLATNEALQAGYDEALMTNDHGQIVEASVANILLVYRGRIITPPIGHSQLEGITTRSAIELLKEDGINVAFEPIDRSMVYTADELILTGTAAQYAFASSVDGRQIGSGTGPGPVCTLLRNRFEEVVNRVHPKSKEWISVFNQGGDQHGC